MHPSPPRFPSKPEQLLLFLVTPPTFENYTFLKIQLKFHLFEEVFLGWEEMKMQNRKSGFIRSGDLGTQDGSKNGGSKHSQLDAEN